MASRTVPDEMRAPVPPTAGSRAVMAAFARSIRDNAIAECRAVLAAIEDCADSLESGSWEGFSLAYSDIRDHQAIVADTLEKSAEFYRAIRMMDPAYHAGLRVAEREASVRNLMSKHRDITIDEIKMFERAHADLERSAGKGYKCGCEAEEAMRRLKEKKLRAG